MACQRHLIQEIRNLYMEESVRLISTNNTELVAKSSALAKSKESATTSVINWITSKQQ